MEKGKYFFLFIQTSNFAISLVPAGASACCAWPRGQTRLPIGPRNHSRIGSHGCVISWLRKRCVALDWPCFRRHPNVASHAASLSWWFACACATTRTHADHCIRLLHAAWIIGSRSSRLRRTNHTLIGPCGSAHLHGDGRANAYSEGRLRQPDAHQNWGLRCNRRVYGRKPGRMHEGGCGRDIRHRPRTC